MNYIRFYQTGHAVDTKILQPTGYVGANCETKTITISTK